MVSNITERNIWAVIFSRQFIISENEYFNFEAIALIF